MLAVLSHCDKKDELYITLEMVMTCCTLSARVARVEMRGGLMQGADRDLGHGQAKGERHALRFS